MIKFNNHISKIIDFVTENNKKFKGFKADSIADAILLIIGTHIGIGKSIFLKNLRPDTRLTNSRITEIKKFTCYLPLKKFFVESLTN